MRSCTAGVGTLVASSAVAAGAFLPWHRAASATQVSLAMLAGPQYDARPDAAWFGGSVALPLLAIAGALGVAALRSSRLLAGVSMLALIGLLTIWLVIRLAGVTAGESLLAAGPLVEIGALGLLVAVAAAPEPGHPRAWCPASR